MAGTVTIGKGADPGYYTEQSQRGTDYYAAGAGSEKPGSEPAGTWTGGGLADLGLDDGGIVNHEIFRAIFGSHVNPRDGTRLGRMLSHRSAETIYGKLLDAEPGATAERRAELFAQAEAKAQKSRPVMFFDATFSVSKSITLLHASARALKLQAQEAGDLRKAAQAQELENTIWNAVKAGADAGIAHLQAHAGFTRTGAGGVRHEDAHGWTAAQWKQHTSRRGDPQLHIHQTILNKVRTDRDGGIRTLDGKALYQERAAAAAVSTMVMENQLTRDLGVRWVQRADGHGREIRGVGQPLMDEFSSRARQDIAPELARRVEEYRLQYGHDPDELALWKMGQAVSREKREPKKDADPAELVREWAQRAREKAGEALEPLAAQVCGQAQLSAQALSRETERAIISKALTSLQSKRSTFTASDLTRAIAEQLPADLPLMPPADAAALLPRLTDQALRGDAGMVIALEAPEFLTIPDALRRADGESVYAAHRATRYATDAQIQMEERIIRTAAERGAPCAEPELVASLLGASRDDLEAQLDPRTPADVTTVTGSGLLLSQAAAAYSILTDDRRVDILVGPAGTGKSKTISVMARLWPVLHPGTRVICLAETQQGANVLRDMGVADSHNISMFLADPRLHENIPAGSLMVLDEASTVTMPHMDALTRIASEAGAKMPSAGDHHQHQAVEAGGAMPMVAHRQGALQLGEALRFTEEWERSASLRLRTGDTSVVPVYDQQGRIVAGTREQMLEESYRRWVTDYLAGDQPLMIAHDQADANELSRRARADLIRYGRVQRGREAALRDDFRCSAGDLVMARQNTSAPTGEKRIANRDVYVVDEIRPNGSAAVRLQTPDGYGPARVLPADYLADECQLAYGRTSHDVQGGTFAGRGYALVRLEDDREYLYTALSRCAKGNFAFAIAEEASSPTGKPVAAEEVARSRMLAAERAGNPEARAQMAGRSGASVLTAVMGRSRAELSATETLNIAYSDADSLAVLTRLWTDLSGGEYARRYGIELRAALGAEVASKVTTDYRYTWLCRSLRAAELAGLDGSEVLRQSISAGRLDDADSVAAVLDHRARQIIPVTLPLDGGWAPRAPLLPEPGADELLAEIGQAMDDRISRFGPHVAETMPLWAERSLGPVPDDPAAYQEWCDDAAAVEAYREMTGWRSPGDPIGPAPGVTDPVARAAWHAALMALANVDGIDLSDLSERELSIRRQGYARETSRAPLHVGRELRLSRQARDEASERASRELREATFTSDPVMQSKHAENAVRWGQLRDKADAAASSYRAAMETRDDWQRIADPTLRAGLAADLEARRRDPWARLEPLKSLEPTSDAAAPDATDQELLAALGLSFGSDVVSDHPRKTAEKAREIQASLDEIAAMPEPGDDPDYEPGEAWGSAAARQREAVKQPAMQLVRPSERVMEAEAG